MELVDHIWGENNKNNKNSPPEPRARTRSVACIIWKGVAKRDTLARTYTKICSENTISSACAPGERFGASGHTCSVASGSRLGKNVSAAGAGQFCSQVSPPLSEV